MIIWLESLIFISNWIYSYMLIISSSPGHDLKKLKQKNTVLENTEVYLDL